MRCSTQAESSSPSASRGQSRPGGDTALLVVLVYLYAHLVIDPPLVHHSLGVLNHYYPFSFHIGWAFFWEHLARPGGLVEYAVRLLSQFFELGWCGALILAIAAWHACWSTDACSRSAGRPRGHVLRFVPAILLLALYGGYNHPLGTVLSLLTGMTGFAAYARWAPQRTAPRITTLVLASALLYHIAGSGSLIFPVVVALYESMLLRRAAIAAAAVLCGVAVPWVAAALFALDTDQAYQGFLFFDPGLLPGKWPLVAALYLFFPLTLAGTALIQGMTSRVSRRRRGKAGADSPRDRRNDKCCSYARQSVGRQRKPRSGDRSYKEAADSGTSDDPRPTFLPSIMVTRCLQAALVLLGAAATAWFSLDSLTGTVLEIDNHCQHERWNEVLTAADSLPAGLYDVRCNRNVMLALHYTGRMGDEMFRYPQRPGVDLFRTPDGARDVGTYFQEGRLFLYMGHVNQAEKCFCEALETCGDMPAILENLALINVVKGRPETARIFLNALARHPLHRNAAREMLGRLGADPSMSGNPRVSGIRGNMAERDFVELDTGVEEFLLALLEKNPRNRIAFELLMAHYLSIGRPDGVVAALPRLKDFAYARVPRHYQEAAAVQSRSMGTPPAVPGYQLDGAVVDRANQFANIAALAGNQRGAMQTALAAGFGDSYFFYLAFGVSGLRHDEQ
jgi:hypothetical protein